LQTEIIANATPHETRIAILEDQVLVEFLIDRVDHERIVGNIYKGTVSAVLPGMQAAFVDIGLEKSAFLHVSDIVDLTEEYADEMDIDLAEREESSRDRRVDKMTPIDDLLRKGQEIVVQVTKEPIGTKGPRVTTQVSLPGRFIVLMPQSAHVGVSRKIEERAERQRLKAVFAEANSHTGGIIVRTAAEGKDERTLRSDLKFLMQIWSKVRKAEQKAHAPALLHRELDLTTRLIRDLFTEEVDRLVIDSKPHHKEIIAYLKPTAPELCDRIKLYKEETPIFDAYDIESEIEKTLHRKIWLKKGGFIVIDHTEALVAIDVNTGRFTGQSNQEETIFVTNMEAAREIARQLRLRDIGGIIVIDFIDMEKESNRIKVVDSLRAALKRDRSRTKTLRVSELGLVEMTRQRVRPGLLQFFSDPCPHCHGTGRILSLASMANKIERYVRRVGVYSSHEQRIRLIVSPDVEAYYRETGRARLRDLSRELRIEVEIAAEREFKRDEVKIISLAKGEDITDQITG
jgi:ribonuclease G